MSAPRFNHVNLPARDPEGLAAWYARLLGAEARGRSLVSRHWLINFTLGEPIPAASGLHLGFAVPSRAAVLAEAQALNLPLAFDQPDFVAVRVTDPEGNLFEIYWDENA